MLDFTQAGRPLTVTTPLGPDVLLLERFEGTEPISGLFRFDLSLLSNGKVPIDFAKILGQKVTVSLALPGGGFRHWNGIVSKFVQGQPVTGPRGRESFVRFKAELVPQFWLWTKRIQCRIFQGVAVPDILRRVLTGLDVQLQGIHGDFAPRECCVQYQESDFAFASRLMEEEGIFYFFQHSIDQHEMILANTPEIHQELAGLANLALDFSAEGEHKANSIYRWEKIQEVPTGKYSLWDYNFEMAHKNLAVQQMIPESVEVGKVTHKLQVADNDQLEIYVYPGAYAHHFDGIDRDGNDQPDELEKVFDDGKRRASLRMQQETAASIRLDGAGNCRSFATGSRFRVVQPWSAMGSYVLTSMEYVASQEGAYTTGAEDAFYYENQFRCIPAGLPYRPERKTPKPVMQGNQTAVVVGPAGRDVFTDKHGRVKVQFYWDRHGATGMTAMDGDTILAFDYWKGRGAEPSASSGWVRVAHASAGRGWGQVAIPRIGQEVVVGYLEGDPDRPIVLGSVYNSVNFTPFQLPQQALASGWKTHSAGDRLDHFNGIAFNDDKGFENAQLHAQRNLILSCGQHLVTNVGGDFFEYISGEKLTLTGSPPEISFSDDVDPDEYTEDSGAGSGSDDNVPWQWTVGNVKSKLGKEFELVFGLKSSALVGLGVDFTVGNKTSLFIDPLSFFKKLAPNLTRMMTPILGPLSGAIDLSIGSKQEFVYRAKTSVTMEPSIDVKVDPSTPEHKILTNLCTAVAILGTLEVLWFGGAGYRIGNNWSDANDWEKAEKIIFGGLGLGLVAAALATWYIAQKLVYLSPTMKTAIDNTRASAAANNQALSAMLTGWMYVDFEGLEIFP